MVTDIVLLCSSYTGLIFYLFFLQGKGNLWFLLEEAWCRFFLFPTARYCDTSVETWMIRDAEAAVMVCMSWIPFSLLRELGRTTDHISTFFLLGCKNWQFTGILPNSILCLKLECHKYFFQNIFVAEAIGNDALSPKSMGSLI